VRHGQGIYQNGNSGDIYHGSFYNDKFSGKGEYIWNLTGMKCKGRFVNGEMDGTMICHDKNGKKQALHFKEGI